MNKILVSFVVGGVVGACSSNAKEDFLADLPDVAQAETSDTSETPDGDDDTSATTSPSDVTSTTEVVDVTTPTELPSGTDVVIPADDLEGFGWHVRLGGQPIGTPVVFDAADGRAVAIPTVNGSAVELRSWQDDGAPLWLSTVYVGTQPKVSGAAFCNGDLTVTGGETGDAKAFIARLDPTATELARVAVSADPEVAGDTRRLSLPMCGGPGVYAVMSGRFLVDLSGTLGAGNPLPTVSSDKIDIVVSAVAGPASDKVFYLGQVNAPKQLGDTTMQIGDQLIYARNYTTDVGGTASSTAFFGDNDVKLIAPAADGRFALVWHAAVVDAPDEQRVTTFDAEGRQIGTAIIPLDAPVFDMRWVGEELVIAGRFGANAPFPSEQTITDGTYLAVITPSAAMTVTRSALFTATEGKLGLHRVPFHGACAGSGWAVMGVNDGVRVVALGDDGSACHSATLLDDDSDADLQSATHALVLEDGEYVFAAPGFLRHARLRVGYDDAP